MIGKLFLENAARLLLLLVAVQFLLIVAWSRWRTRVCTRAVWVGFAALPLLPTFSLLITTPREHVVRLCRELAGLVDTGDVPAIGELLAEHFTSGRLDRDGFLQDLEQRLTRFHVDDVHLRSFDVVFVGSNRALAEFTAVCRVRSVDMYIDRLISRWRLTFVGRGRDWKVTAVQSIPTPHSPFHAIRDFLP